MTQRHQQGFTLIEVLVSMAIFSIGMLGIINMQILSTVTNVQSRGMTEGVIVAQNKIEELMGKVYSSNDLCDGSIDPDCNPHEDTTSNARYWTEWTVEENIPFDGTKTIHMTVNWTRKGIDQGFTIDAVKTKEFN
jgi:type IV pilus assembly protein PilV